MANLFIETSASCWILKKSFNSILPVMIALLCNINNPIAFVIRERFDTSMISRPALSMRLLTDPPEVAVLEDEVCREKRDGNHDLSSLPQ